MTSAAPTWQRRAAMLAGALAFAGLSFLATLDYARVFHYDSLSGLGDLYPRWYGTRELVLHHRSPYSAEVSAEIQTAFYGQPLEARDPRNHQAFAYPVYVSIFLLPLAWLPFPAAKLVMTVVLLSAASLFALCCLQISGWKTSNTGMLVVLIASVGSVPGLMGLMLQQLTLLVAFFIAAGTLALANRRPVLAGFLFACATIKPQLVLVPWLWAAFWSLFQGRRGRRFMGSFVVSLGILVLAGGWMLPGWVSQFLGSASAYRGYSALYPALAITLFGHGAGIVVGACLLCLIVAAGIRFRKVEALDPGFAFMWALTFVVTLIVVPSAGGYVYNHVLLLPAILLVVGYWPRATWLTRAAVAAPLALPLVEGLATRFGYAGPGQPEMLAVMLLLPVIVMALLLVRWRALMTPLFSHQTG